MKMKLNSTELTEPAHTEPMVDKLDQLVDGPTLLTIVWPDGPSRPSLWWLRKQVHAKQIPFVKRGKLIFYIPRSVLAWFKQKEYRPLTMLK